MDLDKSTRIIQTRNNQASTLDAMRELTWNLRCMEHWLEGDKDELLIKKLDKVAEALYDAYHYTGTIRPDRREYVKERAKNILAAHFGGEDGKSSGGEPDRASI